MVAGQATPAAAVNMHFVTTFGPGQQIVRGQLNVSHAGNPPGLTDILENVTGCSANFPFVNLCCDTQAWEAQWISGFNPPRWEFATLSNFNGGCGLARIYAFDNLEGLAPQNDLIRHKYISSNATPNGAWVHIGDNNLL